FAGTQANDESAHPVGPVHSWDEFTRLREVVIGDARGARIPSVEDPSAWLNLFPEMTRTTLAELPGLGLTQRLLDETEEDLALLACALEEASIIVRRSAPLDHGAEFGAPGWRSRGMYSYCPRDLALVLGDTLVETPTPTRARYFECFSLHSLFQEYMRRGARWISAPKPQLADSLYEIGASGDIRLAEDEPVFEAANVLRLGRDIFYQVSGSGNECGLAWLERLLPMLGDLRLHPLRGVYDYTHIDSTMAVLRPGLVLLNPARVSPDSVPGYFRAVAVQQASAGYCWLWGRGPGVCLRGCDTPCEVVDRGGFGGQDCLLCPMCPVCRLRRSLPPCLMRSWLSGWRRRTG
nr:hypothetical protein [Actinomycetota bacterium]